MSEAFEASDPDSAGVVVPPPLLFVLAFGVGGLVDRFWPWPLVATFDGERAVRGCGALLGALSFVLAGWAFFCLRRAGTTPMPVRPTTAIVTAGPFRFTRNPMYVSLTLLLAGVGLALDRGWIALSALLGALLVDRYAIVREERYLERKFGAAYLAYKRTVRRWI